MPIPDMTGLPPFAQFQDMVDKMNVFVQQYNNLLLSLDSLNVVSLTADHIDAGTVNANIVTIRGDYEGGAYIVIDDTGIRINDGTIDTFIVDVNGNAFFTGRITASVIVGSEIKTAETTYPRVELSSSGNIFAAYKSATDYIAIDPDATGNSTLIFENGLSTVLLFSSGATYAINALLGNISINAQNGDITLSSGTGKYTKIAGWSKFLNTNTGQTLQQDLDSKQGAITSGDVTVVAGVATLSNNINTTKLANGSVSNTEFQYLDGVTSSIQTQLNTKPTNVIRQGSGTTGGELLSGGIYYATLVINYTGFASAPKVHAVNTATHAAWISAVTPISSTSATIYLSSTVTGVVASKTIDWTAIGV